MILLKSQCFIEENHLEENVTLVPWLERSKMMCVLQKSQLYVTASRYEGLPYALIEAMALSKPCVATEVDGNKDLVIPNFNGFLVKENKEEMARKISAVLQNREKRHQMSINARHEYMNKYNVERNIRALEKIYLSESN